MPDDVQIRSIQPDDDERLVAPADAEGLQNTPLLPPGELRDEVDRRPLLGERGTAHVFAPQKGADAKTVAHLEAAMAGIEFGEGQIVALVGANGAGKSTLVKALSGLLEHGSDLAGRAAVVAPSPQCARAVASPIAFRGSVEAPAPPAARAKAAIRANSAIRARRGPAIRRKPLIL